MASLLVKTRAKMAIYAHQKVRGVLEGEYGSVFKGRSMDFDDLREYIPGDDVKDIDWKATARSSTTLIKRYIAIRKHNILLVVDTGRNMTAVTATGKRKKDTTVLLAGVIGSLALKHGDFIGLVAGDSEQTKYLPLKSDATHLEQLLQQLDSAITHDAAPSDLAAQLEFTVRNLRRKMIVIVISDEMPFDDGLRAAIRRLRAQHELLWLVVSDADLAASYQLLDVDDDALLPTYIRTNPAVIDAFHHAEQTARESFSNELSRLSIASERVDSEEEAVQKVFHLLERHRSARRA